MYSANSLPFWSRGEVVLVMLKADAVSGAVRKCRRRISIPGSSNVDIVGKGEMVCEMVCEMVRLLPIVVVVVVVVCFCGLI